MTKIEFETIRNNKYFWLYYISTAFPCAYDEDTEISISEFIYENYDTHDAQEWSNNFVQYIDENTEYIDNPNIIELSLNGNNFKAEFQPFETVYYLNGKEIGNTGGHFKLRTLSWKKFNDMTADTSDMLIPLIILPMLALEETEIPKVRKIIHDGISLLDFRSEHIEKITDMIISGLLM